MSSSVPGWWLAFARVGFSPTGQHALRLAPPQTLSVIFVYIFDNNNRILRFELNNLENLSLLADLTYDNK